MIIILKVIILRICLTGVTMGDTPVVGLRKTPKMCLLWGPDSKLYRSKLLYCGRVRGMGRLGKAWEGLGSPGKGLWKGLWKASGRPVEGLGRLGKACEGLGRLGKAWEVQIFR